MTREWAADWLVLGTQPIGNMSFSYPVMLDLTQRHVAVFGGGAVAVRKVRALRHAGVASIVVVSPDFHPDLPAEVRRLTDIYRPSHLEGIDLALAVTNSTAVNDQIVRDCLDRRIWVNRADTSADLPGDFVTPAQLQKGPVIVTVSAGSASLTASIRDGLADRWDDRWTVLAETMQKLRPLVVASAHLPPERRSEILRRLAGDEALERLTRDGVEGFKTWARELIGAVS
ncbi:precorrin-2 dehydrogenase/sirohydrochlorin ferrochelatase family protein [Humisphaera borealis]|uniref:precorrin-2 dehydrogenase n=1 Tax=Humisphaera borealis TaxID=2807512 RepID=A0A7M2WST4_9BACT|nr:bifunctional precorrin-2 dehydrogenase/sirohydrochlorin ferrochelatase [Humisphaera borealis]QOV88585.1 bifunctional precorrin-2 dehydrogenase/sirohydrochlorin ferrochelatase [Humisphaera borealis]